MKDYVTQAIKTESVDLFTVDHPRLLHAAIGLTTEVGELLLAEDGDDINVKEELGDVLWYAAITTDVFEITFDELLSLAEGENVERDPLKALLEQSSAALDHMKKVCFYGVDLDQVKFGRAVANVIYAVQLIGQDNGWSLSDLQETNIAKLRRRYGEKFTVEAAVNRDISAEMEAVANG